VSRRDTELKDRRPGRCAEGGQELRGAQADLLRHDRGIRFDGRHAVAELRQTAGTGGRGDALSHDVQPGRCRSGLFQLLLEAELPGRMGQQIAETFDAMGAELNAATSREHTVVYARVPDRHVEEALEVMTDMVFAPSFAELDHEREVVLEEIAMYEDDPQEKVFDLLGEAVFGEHALSHKLKISGTKSMHGHLLGGAGGLETGITVLALQRQMLPPTINLENVDPECHLDYVPNKAIAHSFDIGLSNSFGFGGINATLIMRRWTE